MARTTQCSAIIEVRRPPARVMELFTPEGERAWAGPHWDPRYPAPDRTVGEGAVFTTEGHGSTSMWVMVDHRPDRVRYARVTPGVSAGTVSVTVAEAGTDACRVEVTYDLTALSAEGEALLDRFEAHFAAEIGGWATAIAAADAG